MTTPNIFKHATSELSQDAMICWLVDCAREATGRLRECGLAFVQALFDADERRVVPPDKGDATPYSGPGEVTSVSCPKRQYGKIDVYFQAAVDGQTVSFIIEDKVHSGEHSNQLARYLEVVRSDDDVEALIKPTFFKTGYIFDDEKDTARGNNYALFSGEDAVKALDPFTEVHPLIDQFVAHLKKHQRDRELALANACFGDAVVQWEFAKRLRAALPEDLRGGAAPKWTQWNGIGRGINRGGGPWTQYPFAGHFCWRLDSPSLRLMLYPREGLTSEPEMRERWERLSSRFATLAADGRLSVVKLRKRRTYRGQIVNEGTVGALALPETGPSGWGAFVDRIVSLTERLLKEAGA